MTKLAHEQINLQRCRVRDGSNLSDLPITCKILEIGRETDCCIRSAESLCRARFTGTMAPTEVFQGGDCNIALLSNQPLEELDFAESAKIGEIPAVANCGY